MNFLVISSASSPTKTPLSSSRVIKVFAINEFGSVRRIPLVSSSSSINASPVNSVAFKTIGLPFVSSAIPVCGNPSS